MAEGQRLQRITRTAKNPLKLRRSIVVLMSAQGQPAPDIAHLLKTSEDYVRDVIHAFNERGVRRLGPNRRRWCRGPGVMKMVAAGLVDVDRSSDASSL
ncbi:helix-turn-helix domain-containing protein [Micromonospora sp. LZ34]